MAERRTQDDRTQDTGHRMVDRKSNEQKFMGGRPWTDGGPTDKSPTNVLGQTEVWRMSLDRQKSMDGQKLAMWRRWSQHRRMPVSFTVMANGNAMLQHCKLVTLQLVMLQLATLQARDVATCNVVTYNATTCDDTRVCDNAATYSDAGQQRWWAALCCSVVMLAIRTKIIVIIII